MQKVYALFVISMLILLFLGYLAIQKVNHEFIHQQVEHVVTSSQQLLNNEMEEDVDSMKTLIRHFRTNKTIKASINQGALQQSDLADVVKSHNAIYRRNVWLNIYDVNGASLAAGDLSSFPANVLKKISSTGKEFAKNVVLLPSGMPVLQIISRLYVSDQDSPLVVVSLSMEKTLKELRLVINRQFYVLTDFRIAPASAPHIALNQQGLPPHWHLVKDLSELHKDHSTERFQQLVLLTLSGLDKPEAAIGVLIDFDPFLQQIESTERLILVESLMVVIVILLLIYLILNRIENVLTGYREKAEFEERERNLEREQYLENLESQVLERTQDLEIAHRETAESEKRYRRLVDNIGQGFTIFSFLPNGDVVYASPGVASILELPHGIVVGEKWGQLVNWLPESLHRAEQVIASVTRGDSTEQVFEISFVARNGRIKTLNVSMHGIYDHKGDLYCLEGIAEDITQQRRMLQEMSRLTREARQASEAKSQFIAEMSHELRTPMHAILSFSSLALKRVDEPKVQDYLDKILTSGYRLTDLLNNLLDLSKLEAGKMELLPVEFDMVKLIQQVVDELHGLLLDANIKIQTNADEPMFCEADDKLLIQVLTNLLSNAIKFSPSGSAISIFQEYIVREGIRYLQVVIRDEGIGVPADQLESIFDEFEQSSQTRGDYKGTGLGLPITRKIVQLHQGIIWAESPIAGKTSGTAFYMQIPQKQANVLQLGMVV